MSFFREFKEFAMKGTIIELAIAVIIGAAFGAIINSLVDDVITPLLLTPALKAAHAEDITQLSWNAVKYGKFLAAVIKFIIVALVLFSMVKAMNRYSKKKEVVSGPSSTDALLMQIRDELRNK